MADRVAYLTTQDNMTPANTSGCNTFAIPFDTVTTVPNYNCPIIRSLDFCDDLWWRIKNWAVTTDASITQFGTTNTMYNGVLIPDSVNATTELDLELATSNHSFSSPSSSTDALTFICAQVIGQSSGDLYPQQVLTSAVVGVGTSSIQFRLFEPDPFLPPADGSITGTIYGQSITVYFYISGTPDSYTFSSFDLSPVEWWPFKTTTGLPVWSTTTGAMLNDPRS